MLPGVFPLDVDLECLGGGAGAPGHKGAADTSGFAKGQHWLDNILTISTGNLISQFQQP